MLTRPDLSVIIPAYCEASRLPETLDALRTTLRTSPLRAEVVVVDDGSTDDTALIAKHALKTFDQGHLVRLPGNAGKGAAVRAGVARASGNKVVFMDADLATDLGALGRVVTALDTAHVAIGSRAVPGSTTTAAPSLRVGMGRSFNRLARAASGLPYSDTQCGFKGFQLDVARTLFHLSTTDGYAFDVEVLLLADRIGYTVAEVPVHWEAMAGSHIRPVRDSFVMAKDVVRSSTRWRRRSDLRAVVARSIQAASAGAEETLSLVRGAFGIDWPIVPHAGGVTTLLPLADDARAARVLREFHDVLPRHRSDLITWSPQTILGPGAASVRSALTHA